MRALWAVYLIIASLWLTAAAMGQGAAGPGGAAVGASPFFRITIVDAETSRGIPLVRLTTTNKIEYYTDSAGVIAFCEPELMGQDVLVTLFSFGYEFGEERPGFGFRRRRMPFTTIHPMPGGSATLPMRRTNIAQRLYRMTGADIYRDSVLLGDQVPAAYAPLQVSPTGQDSVATTIYKGKLFWIWGDTLFANNFMGNFRTTGATSALPGEGVVDPDKGVYLEFFQKDGRIRPMINMEHSPIWLSNLRVARDGGRERLFANYVKVVSMLMPSERGIVEFNDATEMFDFSTSSPLDSVMYPDGFACFAHKEKGKEFYYYLSPWPNVRSQMDAESIRNLETYEAFSCLKDGSRFSGDAAQLDRDKDGNLIWRWRKNTTAMDEHTMGRLIASGAMKPEEAWYALCDVETSETIVSHHGSVFYNAYRDRWISIRGQRGGSHSEVGELFYFEGDTPLGPWVYGRRIVTHFAPARRAEQAPNAYSFYNPYHHVEFDQDGGRVIYFEGTYTEQFSGAVKPTPRYDYNQIMYKMELDDPRLILPVPVYVTEGRRSFYRTKSTLQKGENPAALAFFALDRPASGSVPVYAVSGKAGSILQRGSSDSGETTDAQGNLVFFAYAGEDSLPGDLAYHAVPLYGFADPKTGTVRYAPEGTPSLEEWQRAEKPLCWVWRGPIRFSPFAVAN